jgi:threonine dehydrogenase-like Zn-dependent dehydrogenase
MTTKALRLYGKEDLRLEEFELPEPKEDELLVKIVSDTLCMSSYWVTRLGKEHRRVPPDIAEKPIVLGHELCGDIVAVGKKLGGRFEAGTKFTMQPAMKGTPYFAGYSFEYIGGDMQYGVIPASYIEQGCVLPYTGGAYFLGSLAEPVSCVIGAMHASYHTVQGEYAHLMDIKEGGCMALLAGAGPMGLGFIDYAIHRERRPSLLVVTDIDESRLKRAAELLPVQDAEKQGVKLVYLNISAISRPSAALLSYTDDYGFDDVFILAPDSFVIEQANDILAYDGCLNYFAAPPIQNLKAPFIFYNAYFHSAHLVGINGGSANDMRKALQMTADKTINPAIMITHIGGLDSAGAATLGLPSIPGGKKLIYTHIMLPLTAIADFGEQQDPLFKQLDIICKQNGGLWCAEAEGYLLSHAKPI